MEEEMETNEARGKAHKLEYDPTEIPVEAMIPLAKLLTKEAGPHGEGNWEKLTVCEHVKHLHAHLFEYEQASHDPRPSKDKLDYELIRVMARSIYAYAVFTKNVNCDRY